MSCNLSPITHLLVPLFQLFLYRLSSPRIHPPRSHFSSAVQIQRIFFFFFLTFTWSPSPTDYTPQTPASSHCTVQYRPPSSTASNLSLPLRERQQQQQQSISHQSTTNHHPRICDPLFNFSTLLTVDSFSTSILES